MPTAVKRVKSALIFKEIAKLENIKADETKIDKEIEALKNRYAQDAEAVKSISSPGYRSYVSNFFLNQEIVENLKKWNSSEK